MWCRRPLLWRCGMLTKLTASYPPSTWAAQRGLFTRHHEGNIGIGLGLCNANLNRIVTPALIEDLGLKDTLTYRIVQQPTTKDILDFVSIFVQQNPDGRHIAHLAAHLLKTHFSTKLEIIPWLHTDMHIAYIQLMLNGKLYDILKEVTEHPNFSVLCETITKHIQELTNDELTDCTLSLLYLGIDQTLPVIHRLLGACHKNVHTFNMTSIATMCNIGKCLTGTDAYMMPKLLKRYQQVLADKDYVWAVSDARAHFLAAIRVQKFSSDSLIDQFLTKVEQLQENPKILNDPDCLSAMTRTLQSLGPKKSTPEPQKLLGPALKACFDNVNELEPPNIADICSSLKIIRIYKHNLREVFERRVLDIIKRDGDALKIRDVCNLMFALTKQSSRDICLTVDNILHNRLSKHPVDSVILSNLAKSLCVRECRQEILVLFYQRVAEQLVAYISRYKKTMNLLTQHGFRNMDHRLLFTEALLRALDRQHWLSMVPMASIAELLVPHSYNALPDVLVEKLLVAIRKGRSTQVERIAFALSNVRSPPRVQHDHQVKQIQSSLYTAILQRVHHINSLDYLHILTLRLVVENKNRDSKFTDCLIHLYLSFSKNLTDVGMTKVADVLSALKYHLPELIDDLVNFAVSSSQVTTTPSSSGTTTPTPATTSSSSDEILTLLVLCSEVGYQPQQCDLFVQAVRKAYADMIIQGHYTAAVSVLYKLSLIQCFPQEELTQLFSIDFLEKLDKYMEENPQLQPNLAHKVMLVNRAAVLECPQLDIPWFHDTYCKDNFKMAERSDVISVHSWFGVEVGHMLEHVLESDEYVSRLTHSPYHHPIHYECILDEKGHPLPMDSERLLHQRNIQRVAVLCAREGQYCFNYKQLSGQASMRRRHLEIMGYRVVLISHREWLSMADWQAKIDYLHSKVFGLEDLD